MTGMGETDVSAEMDGAGQAPRPEQANAPPTTEHMVESSNQDDSIMSPGTNAKSDFPNTGTAPPSIDPTSTGRSKRERKQVDFFSPVTLEKEEQPSLKQGHGLKLRDIPNVAYKLGKVTGRDDLAESLHQLLFRRKGLAHTRKRDIMDFCGFAFDNDDKEREMKYRKDSLGKWKLDLIHKLMDCLDLPRGSGEKSSKVDRIMEFLVKPEQLRDINLADKDAEKREKAKAKKEREMARKEKEKAKKEKARIKKDKIERNSASVKRKAFADKKKPAKKAKHEEKREHEGFHSHADSGEPLADPAQQLTKEQLYVDLETELDEMASEELETMNVRLLLGKLGDKYGFDVKSRKAEIKTMAVEYCNRRLAGEDNKEEGGTGDVDKEEQQELETVQPHLEESNEGDQSFEEQPINDILIDTHDKPVLEDRIHRLDATSNETTMQKNNSANELEKMAESGL